MVNLNISSKVPIEASPKSSFEEVQKVCQTWIWVVLPVAFAGLVLMIANQVMFRQVFGENLLTFSSIIFVTILLSLFTLLIYKAHLVTKIDEYGIRYRFYPLQIKSRTIYWKDVVEVYIREYDGLSEYGGWGIKFGKHGKAYTVKGRYGLQIELSDERKILIGTQKPIELEKLMLHLLYDYEVH